MAVDPFQEKVNYTVPSTLSSSNKAREAEGKSEHRSRGVSDGPMRYSAGGRDPASVRTMSSAAA
jgi:hypothetical protein